MGSTWVNQDGWLRVGWLHVGLAKKITNATQKEFSTPARAKQVKFRRAAASYKR